MSGIGAAGRTPVIPAKAGIHVGCFSQCSFRKTTLDSSLRWNDEKAD